MLIKQGGCWE